MEEKALDKIDIASELKILSPIEAKSIELKKQADEIEITDKVTYSDAKKIRKALVSHRTGTKDLRLTFTRKLDNLKDQFIKKQDEVLEASLAGEEVVKDKIAAWEKAEQDRKDAEEKRMKEIISKFDIKKLDRQTATPEDIKRERARIKMERGLLEPNDRIKVAVKNAVAAYNEYLDETEQFIVERMEQERIAEEQRIEQERLDNERKKLEEEKAAAEAAKTAEAPAKDSTPEPISTPVTEPAKENEEPLKESAEQVGVAVGAPHDPEVKKWYIVTEEGVEGSGQDTPLAAFVEYLELTEVTEERIDEIVSGHSEINHVAEYSQAELDAMPEV